METVMGNLMEALLGPRPGGSAPMAPPRDRRSGRVEASLRPAGFSLIEVIVVIAILAVLAGIAVPTVDLLQVRARSDATIERMDSVERALEEFFQDNLRFPDPIDELETGGYLVGAYAPGDVFLDGWGNGFDYDAETDHCVLSSLGPDQTASDDDIVLRVDGVRFFLARTREDMRTLHHALQQYEARRAELGLPPLPADWYDDVPGDCAMGLLVQGGYLANSDRYRADAWGDEYAFAGSPHVHVTSPNLD